jgi:quercetin dioxygenase-like cupin family protein
MRGDESDYSDNSNALLCGTGMLVFNIPMPRRLAVEDVVLSPGTGRLVDLGGLGVQFKIRGELTGGAFAVVEHPVDPGVVVEPHIHTYEDEYSYVLEGTVGVRVGDHESEVGPGSYVLKPRGVLHTFWNAGPAPARVLEIISPAGFERFFEELADLMADGLDSDDDRIDSLLKRYGLTFDRTWLPDLDRRFGPLRMV